jgi:hypothetical protein
MREEAEKEERGEWTEGPKRKGGRKRGNAECDWRETARESESEKRKQNKHLHFGLPESLLSTRGTQVNLIVEE